MRISLRCSLLLLVLILALLGAAAGAGADMASAAKLTGQITDAVSGDPLPHATVHAWYADGTNYTYWRADADGSYEIYLSDGVWKLSYAASFHVSEYWNDKPDLAAADPVLVSGVPLSGMDVALARSPQAHIQGTVVDGTTGEPIDHVMVTACDHERWNGGPYTYTAADGTYDLTVWPGTWGLTFDHHGHARRYWEHQATSSDATLLTLADGDVRDDVDETLPRNPVMVTAVTLDVDGEVVPGIELQLLDATDRDVVRTAVSGDDGVCSIDAGDLLGRQLKIRVHDPAGVFVDAYHIFRAGGAPTFEEGATITPTLGSSYRFTTRLYSVLPGEIRGRTLNAAGEPLGDVAVWIRGYGGTAGLVETRSGADGYYSAPGLQVSRQSRFIVAFHQDDNNGEHLPAFFDAVWSRDAATPVSVAPGQAVTVDSRLYKAATIQGTVTGLGEPLRNVTVSLYDADGDVIALKSTTDAGGFAFRHLWPGDYRVGYDDPSTWDSDDLPGYKDAFLGGATLDEATVIHLDGVTATVVLPDAALEPWGGVKVEALCDLEPYSRVGGLEVTLYDADRRPLMTTDTTSAGGYLFRWLPLGTYYVACTDPRRVFEGEAFDDAESLDGATPIVLTESAPKAALTMHLHPLRGVLPDAGALPDGSTTASSLRLGICPQAIAVSGETSLICGQGTGLQHGGFVFRHGDAGWAQDQLLSYSPTRAWDADVDGDVAVVGSMTSGTATQTDGWLTVYRRNGGEWQLEARLRPSSVDSYRGFGLSVAVSGDTILAGAPIATVGTRTTAGAVYVFVHGASGWTESARITSATPARSQRFGSAVALESDHALVSSGAATSGSVHVFERTDGEWRRAGDLLVPALFPSSRFGADLAIDGDTALVGAPGHDVETGAVYVFDRGDGGWAGSATLTAADGQLHDCFGEAVDLEDGRALIGAPARGSAVSQFADGAAYLFRREESGWRQDAAMLPVLGVTAANFGARVAVAGSDLFVGAPGETRVDGAAGRVHVFRPYVTESGVALVVDAGRGVLANDVGPEGMALSAELVTGPAHGSLELGTDGSFRYDPDSGFLGGDQFTYRAVSGDWQSDPATVDVTVRGLAGPTLEVEGVSGGWVNKAPTVTLEAEAAAGEAAIEYRRGASAVWTAYDAPIRVAEEGVSDFATRSRDVFGNSSAEAFRVKLDTRRPRPKAPAAATVRRGRTCTLRYLIADATPGSPTANVRIVIRNARGKQKWVARLYGRPVNKSLKTAFRCTLPAGAYRFYVYATDAAGNPQTAVAKNKLRVR